MRVSILRKAKFDDFFLIANCPFCIVDGSQTKHEFEVMLVIENELYTYYLLNYIKFVK